MRLMWLRILAGGLMRRAFAPKCVYDADSAEKYLTTLHQDTTEVNDVITRRRYENLFDLQIIIPVYNGERHLKECLDSVVTQVTKYKYRVVVINDGSTDSSASILSLYASDIEIVSQSNMGLGAARNRGLETINASYVAFVDCDDVIASDFVETMLDEAYSSGADVVQCLMLRFDGENLWSVGGVGAGLYEGLEKVAIEGFACGKIFRASLFDEFNFPSGCIFEDTVISMCLLDRANSVSVLRHALYLYRVNPIGLTETASGNYTSIDTVYVTRRLLASIGERQGLNQYVCERFIQQSRVNYRRCAKIGDDYLMMCLFVMHLDMYNRNFKGKCFSRRGGLLDMAYRWSDFTMWTESCKL